MSMLFGLRLDVQIFGYAMPSITLWKAERVLFHADTARTGSWRISDARLINWKPSE